MSLKSASMSEKLSKMVFLVYLITSKQNIRVLIVTFKSCLPFYKAGVYLVYTCVLKYKYFNGLEVIIILHDSAEMLQQCSPELRGYSPEYL